MKWTGVAYKRLRTFQGCPQCDIICRSKERGLMGMNPGVDRTTDGYFTEGT